MVSSRAQVGVDDPFHTYICLSIGSLESPSPKIEERSQKHCHHGDIRMHIICRWGHPIEDECAYYLTLELANKIGETYIHGSVGSVLGAFAISLLGSAYSRQCNGYAFAAMVPGVLLLVPTGLIAVGGLAQNYSSDDDQFANGLNTGLAMIQSTQKACHLICPNQRWN